LTRARTAGLGITLTTSDDANVSLSLAGVDRNGNRVEYYLRTTLEALRRVITNAERQADRERAAEAELRRVGDAIEAQRRAEAQARAQAKAAQAAKRAGNE
jgi:hypothetical protein